MINTIIVQGRLTAEPELKKINDEVAVTNFIIAVDRPRRKDSNNNPVDVTDFFKVVAWRSRAEFVCKYFHKGDLIAITGSLHNDVYIDRKDNNKKKSSPKIVAREIHFCGFKKGNSEKIDLSDLSDEVREEFGEDDDLPFD